MGQLKHSVFLLFLSEQHHIAHDLCSSQLPYLLAYTFLLTQDRFERAMPGNNTKGSTRRVRYREHPEPFVNEAIADLGRCAFWKCRKGPADLPEGHKMKVCSRCNKISLSRYYYCSRYVLDLVTYMSDALASLEGF